VPCTEDLDSSKWQKKYDQLPHAFVRAIDNETPREIASRVNQDVDVLVEINSIHFPGLHADARLIEGTLSPCLLSKIYSFTQSFIRIKQTQVPS
jgi:hypothetical protein